MSGNRVLYLVPLGGLGNVLFQAAFSQSINADYPDWKCHLVWQPGRSSGDHIPKPLTWSSVQRNLIRILARAGAGDPPPGWSTSPFVGLVRLSRTLYVGMGYFQTNKAASFDLVPVLDRWHNSQQCDCAYCEGQAGPPSQLHPPAGSARRTSVHVRLGDYLVGGNPRIQGVTNPLSQLIVAAETHSQNNTEGPICVFTDSPAIVRRFLKHPLLSGYEFEFADASCAACLLLDMATSQTLVMSNSSLSWWAGILACHRGAQVLQPWPWMHEPTEMDRLLRIQGASSFKRQVLNMEQVAHLSAAEITISNTPESDFR